MKNLRTNPILKVLFRIMALSSGLVFLFSGFYVLVHADSLFGSGYRASSEYADTLFEYREMVETRLDLLLESQLQDLTYFQQSYLSSLEEFLDPETTNFRYVVRNNNTGEILYSNTAVQNLDRILGTGEQGIRTYSLYDPGILAERIQNGLLPNVDSEAVKPFSEGTEKADGEEWAEITENDIKKLIPTLTLPSEVVIEYGVLEDLVYEDDFFLEWKNYEPGDPFYLLIFTLSVISMLIFTGLLCYSTGFRKESEEVHLSWIDKIPYDIFIFIMGALVMGSLGILCELIVVEQKQSEIWVLMGIMALTCCWFCLDLVLSSTRRLRAHTLIRNTLCWRLFDWLRCTLGGVLDGGNRILRGLAGSLPMSWRFVIMFLIYLLVNGVLAAGLFLSSQTGLYLLELVIVNAVVIFFGCRWVVQWRMIREGTEAIVWGNPSTQIDTAHMFYDLREHAQALNSLGDSITRAVDERMKSEHFKTELITNVSHDLKTPLTSIINYVDLMKKEPIDNPRVLEYLEILDRKSQRLKKLTEDLVEASKASTGNVTVNFDRINLSEFTQQAAAEYEERLSAHDLKLVLQVPEEPVPVNADGRHMWRILDNLLGNCAKYALEGTRVYLEVTNWEGKASICLKNISRDQLPPEPNQLTERFVRGDASRSTEGSGLGLSIARSLTEVKGGNFYLVTDGDLFKAVVSFPTAPAIVLEKSDILLA